MDDRDAWQRLIHGFQTGDQAVMSEFWNQYGEHLIRIADAQLAKRLRRRLGPEDVVQSACRTFFRRVQNGQLELTDAESLWRLLCAITITKVREKARFHLRQKRGVDNEIHEMSDPDSTSTSGLALFAGDPTPSDAAAFAEQFERIFDALDDEERQILDLKLQSHTHEEVAEKLNISERTTRRLFKRIQTKLQGLFD